MPPRSPSWRLLAGVLLAAWCAGGCLYSRAQSDTPRTATEQLLLTQAIESAVTDVELPDLRGRTVALETVSLTGADAAYLETAMRERVRQAGAQLGERDAAEMVLVLFVGTLGTVFRGVEFGIPPIPLSGYTTPGLPLFRILKQRGYTKLRIVAHDAEGRHLEERGPVLRRTKFEVYSVLFLAVRRNDIYPGEQLEISID